MSDTVLISWNVTNWITVLLMLLLGSAVWSLVTGFVARSRSAE